MGFENNECIIATTWDEKSVGTIMEWVKTINPEFQPLFVLVPSIVNGKQTIIMVPDGSKKGWDTAEQGRRLRDEFVKLLKSFDYEDGSNPFDFVEVGYGGFGQKILRGNCENVYGDDEYYLG